MNVLNYQLFKILTTNDSITVDRLVSELQVSKKTLQKYITSLNEELGEIAEIQEKNQKVCISSFFVKRAEKQNAKKLDKKADRTGESLLY